MKTRVLFFGEGRIRHSVRTVAALLERGSDVIILEVEREQNKYRNRVKMKRLSSVKGGNESLFVPHLFWTVSGKLHVRILITNLIALAEKIAGRTSSLSAICSKGNCRVFEVAHIHDVRGEIVLLSGRRIGRLYSLKIKWAPDMNAIFTEEARFRIGKEFYKVNPVPSQFLENRMVKRHISARDKNLKEFNSENFEGKDAEEFQKKIKEFIKCIEEAIHSKKESSSAVVKEIRRIAQTVQVDLRIINVLKRLKISKIVITSLVFQETLSHRLIHAAKLVGIKTIYQVFSWDNLSTKSSFAVEPDGYLVWNQYQERELRQLHFAESPIYVTGASRFEGFVKFPTVKAYRVLYIGSSYLGDAADLVVFSSIAKVVESIAKKKKQKIDFVFKMHKDGPRKSEIENVIRQNAKGSVCFMIENSRDNIVTSITMADIVFAQNTSAVLESLLMGKVPHRIETVKRGSEPISNHVDRIREFTLTHKNLRTVRFAIESELDRFLIRKNLSEKLEVFLGISDASRVSNEEASIILQ